MKKFICLCLALGLLLALASCAADAAPTQPTTTAATTADGQPILRVGFAQENITPSDPVPMAADGDTEDAMNTGIIDYLFATCVYFVDAQGTELYLIAFDLCNMYDPLPEYRLALAKKLGVAEAQVMLSASHTHSAVALRATQVPSVLRYIDSLKKQLETVARKAKDDAKAATGMYHSAIETSGLNFVRRYIMNDGSYAGDNYGNHSLGYAAHESEGDRQLQLLKFTREGGKDIILTNFQTHPHRTAYDTDDNRDLSSDIVGVYRQALEQQLDCHALYYTGASGNVNPTSRMVEENVFKDHRTHGQAMAQFAVKAAEHFTPLQLGEIRLKKTVYVGQSYLSENYKLEDAKIVAERYRSGMGKSASLEGYEDLFEHPRHAIAIVSRAGWPATREVNLYTFSIGQFTACYAPFELFAELGVMIKEGSPFEATFVCCYSNDIFSYMPTKEAFEHGGYGPYKCNFEPGTGEILVDVFLTDMQTLYDAR